MCVHICIHEARFGCFVYLQHTQIRNEEGGKETHFLIVVNIYNHTQIENREVKACRMTMSLSVGKLALLNRTITSSCAQSFRYVLGFI